MNTKRRIVDAYSEQSEFRRIESPYVDLNPDERFRNVFLGGLSFVFSTLGLIANFMRATRATSAASGWYSAGTVVGTIVMTIALGAIWYASLSMVFRSQKLRGYRGVDTSSDLVIFAMAVFAAGLLVVILTGIMAILGDAVNPNASRMIPVILCFLSMIPTSISGFYLRWRSRRLAARPDEDDEPTNEEDDE